MVHNGSAPHTPPTTPPLTAPATEQVGSLGTNGRSSGRKRTPKACDCCGPNSRHHDNKTPQTGKARRGRPPAGRGKGQDLGGHTPKRKGRTPIKKPLQNEQQVVGLTCRLGEVNNTVVVEEVTNSVDQQITISLDDPVRNSTDEQVTESEMEQEEGEGCSEGERVERVAGSEREQQEAYLDNEPSQGTDSNMEVVPQTSGGEPALSNGRPTSTPPDESSTTGAGPTSVPMEAEPSAGFCLSPCITLHTIHNPFALWDHIHYCKPGVWASGPGDEEGEGAPLAQTAQQELCPADMNHEGIRDLIHEFLEHFYVKYGSFIPLSEGDVLEHLKTKCNTDLNNGKFNIHSEVVKYKAGLASAPMHCFKVTYNKHTLTLEDLSTLDDQNWVNDQVINMYGELIMEATQHKVHFFNSFFHRQLVAKGYEGVKRWTKKVDLFSKRLLMIPIHLEIHWSLITVDIASHHINYYDSQGVVFKYTVDNIMRYILAEAKEKQQAGYQKGWKMIVNKGIPQQKNDSDCGVFVLEYCKCLALKEPLQFTQEDMPKFRKRIYKELCDCKLTV